MTDALVNGGVASLVSGVVSTVVWMAIRRPIDQMCQRAQALEQEVRTLRDEKFVGLRDALAAHSADNLAEFAKGADRRKDIYARLDVIGRDMVTRQDCAKSHERMSSDLAGQMERFVGAVTDLARLQARGEDLAAQLRSLAEQVAALNQDVARMHGRMDKQ